MNYDVFYSELNQTEREMLDIFKKILADKNPQSILEIGSGWGFSARCFMEFSSANLITVDKAKIIIDKQGRNSFDLWTDGFQNRITRITGDSKEVVPSLKDQYDMAYIDGDHAYETVLKDIVNVYPLIKKGGVILLDDVWHKGNWETPNACGVTRALSEGLRLLNHPTMTIYFGGNGLGRIDL